MVMPGIVVGFTFDKQKRYIYTAGLSLEGKGFVSKFIVN
jgi:hypothetical protein